MAFSATKKTPEGVFAIMTEADRNVYDANRPQIQSQTVLLPFFPNAPSSAEPATDLLGSWPLGTLRPLVCIGDPDNLYPFD